MPDMDFLKDFKKDLAAVGLSEGSAQPPAYWFSTGNVVVNQIISGSVSGGIPQGRITGLAGNSGSGKSFLACNAMREAQKAGAHIVTLDSENALDDEFVSKIGVDVNRNYTYVSVDTIPQVQRVVSAFLTGYKKEYGDSNEDNPDQPKILFVIDSLDMLITETEGANFKAGKVKGDQGQRNKQLKAMLRQFVQAIKHLNVSMLVTDQVYKNQDLMNGEGVWIVKDAIRFSLSQILLLTKLKLRDKDSRDVQGIRMKVEGFKTRFTKPYQTVTISVPYDTGMDPFNGLLDVAVTAGIVNKKGSRYICSEKHFGPDQKSFYEKDFASKKKLIEDILVKLQSQRDLFLEAVIGDDVEEDVGDGKSGRQRRTEKHKVEK